MRKMVFDDRQTAPDMKRKFLPSAVVEDKTLGDRQIRVVVSTPTPDRVKDVLEPTGIDVSSYRANPIVLADHDRTAPIGTAEIEIKSDRVEAVITFAPAGASAKADEYCALAKAGVLNTVSPGFIEKDASPMKGGGVHVKKWELLELSLVTVPCNAEATVIERKLPERAWRVGASLNLPLAPEGAKGLSPVESGSIDARTAHKGCLAYDSGAVGKSEGYAIPFARVIDGRLMVEADTIKSARAALAEANFPDDVKTKASAVLDHYEAKLAKPAEPARIKSLYEVACLANLLDQLGWFESWIEADDAAEGEPGVVAQKLTDALRSLGDALIQMTADEVAELLGEETSEKAALPVLTKAMTEARVKAGRTISKATADEMRAACKMIADGHASIMKLVEPESPAEDAGETMEEKSAPDTGEAAPTLTQRERDLDLLRLKKAK